MIFDPDLLKAALVPLETILPAHVLSELSTINTYCTTTPNPTKQQHTLWRLCHFLAQCAHESGNFHHREEKLNYAPHDLNRLFFKYFPNVELQTLYGHNPEKIGSRIYANRMGNGDESSREGFIFRGRGYLQLTGKRNYQAFSAFISDDCVGHPEHVAQKYPMISAAWFFQHNNLWGICDAGSTEKVVETLTRHINGGKRGLTQRIGWFQHFFTLVEPIRHSM